jgi:hypothetical protein
MDKVAAEPELVMDMAVAGMSQVVVVVLEPPGTL